MMRIRLAAARATPASPMSSGVARTGHTSGNSRDGDAQIVPLVVVGVKEDLIVRDALQDAAFHGQLYLVAGLDPEPLQKMKAGVT